MTHEYGPTLGISKEIDSLKYCQKDETFREARSRVANSLADDEDHFYITREILLEQRFLAAGRVQSAVGSARRTTAFNCFVSPTIEDSMDGIMDVAKIAAQTMRLGGGIGYDFSTIRPKGDIIVSLDSTSSGVLSFMMIYDAICKTVASAGNRRGAQMAVLRIDHPDIEEFIEAKTNETAFTQFNLSVGITDAFMRAVEAGEEFELKFNGRVYARVDACNLWDRIMRATWDWAEPGILFIDRINEMNNLWYCETISATNPCGEQPLPPNGACLLGSFNLVKYLLEDEDGKYFNWQLLKEDIPEVVRMMDNVIDNTTYPLPEQEREAKSKRRIGLGFTAVANTGEALGMPYGSEEFLDWYEQVAEVLANGSYQASSLLAKEKGVFPLFDKDKYRQGKFLQVLSQETLNMIDEHGIRNSHLLSIAPTGTISLSADNVSSGIEPVFSYQYDRVIQTDDGAKTERVTDYGFREFSIRGKTADECSVEEHLNVLTVAAKWVDSAVSKTLNVGEDVSWKEFSDIYMTAWKVGVKGCTTFRASGLRYGILNKVEESVDTENSACYINTETGIKECS